MKKKRINLKAKERQVERLAEAESNVRTRLVEMRIDLDALMHVLDRLTCEQPRMRAGGGLLPSLDNLLRFSRMR
jgi:hypothetical protein